MEGMLGGGKMFLRRRMRRYLIVRGCIKNIGRVISVFPVRPNWRVVLNIALSYAKKVCLIRELHPRHALSRQAIMINKGSYMSNVLQSFWQRALKTLLTHFAGFK